MSTPNLSDSVLSFEDARASTERQAKSLRAVGVEHLAVLCAVGRALAEDLRADRDLPPFPRATRDGYAVRAADVASLPAKLTIIGQIKAGSSLPSDVKMMSGTCAEIMTGAPVPQGADAVVMVEHTSATGSEVTIDRTVSSGENIVPRGSEAKDGQLLLSKGTRVGYAQVAVATSVGRSKLAVFKRPRVAIISTGDEIIDLDSVPGAYQIRNSNSFSLAAQIMTAGGEPVQLPIAPDEPIRLRELVAEGFKSDLLVLTGGVSMGKYDIVEDVLREFDAEFFFTGAKIQPGKPVVFGQSKKTGKYFLGLPGNPISTMVTFELFARPLIDALSGAEPAPLVFAKARLADEFRTKPGLTRFLPAILSGPYPDPQVELIRWQGSGDVVSMSRSNCLLVIPPDKEVIAAGEQVSVLLNR